MKYQVHQYVNTSVYHILTFSRTYILSPLSRDIAYLYPMPCPTILSILSSASLISLSNCDTPLIRSIILPPSSLFLSLKISYISKSFTRGIISSSLTQCPILLIPPIRSSASLCRSKLVSLILSIGKVISLCSCYIKKGLVYIMIAAPSSH